MAKVTPTTKSCSEILKLIVGDYYTKMYVQPVYDSYDTHALYGVYANEVDKFKERIKSIGGKYIRVVSAQWKGFKIICFALEITPQEELEKKMKAEREERFQRAYESKLSEIKTSILLI